MYKVRLSQRAREHAFKEFSSQQSSQRKPTFAQFRDGPLKAVEFVWSRNFDKIGDQSSPLREFVTEPSAFFPPVGFYGWKVKDGSENVVEIVDFVVDWNYWDEINNDPD